MSILGSGLERGNGTILADEIIENTHALSIEAMLS